MSRTTITIDGALFPQKEWRWNKPKRKHNRKQFGKRGYGMNSGSYPTIDYPKHLVKYKRKGYSLLRKEVRGADEE